MGFVCDGHQATGDRDGAGEGQHEGPVVTWGLWKLLPHLPALLGL